MERGRRPFSSAKDGISSRGATVSPPTRTKWHPMPNRGCCFARTTASSNAGPLAINVVLVRIPSRWARIMPSFTPRVRPKSSAFRISSFIVGCGHLGAGAHDTTSKPRLRSSAGLQDVRSIVAVTERGTLFARSPCEGRNRQSNSSAIFSPAACRIVNIRLRFSTVLLKTMWKRPAQKSKMLVSTRLTPVCTNSVQKKTAGSARASNPSSFRRSFSNVGNTFEEKSRKGQIARLSIPMRRRLKLNCDRFFVFLHVEPFSVRMPALGYHLN